MNELITTIKLLKHLPNELIVDVLDNLPRFIVIEFLVDKDLKSFAIPRLLSKVRVKSYAEDWKSYKIWQTTNEIFKIDEYEFFEFYTIEEMMMVLKKYQFIPTYLHLKIFEPDFNEILNVADYFKDTQTIYQNNTYKQENLSSSELNLIKKLGNVVELRVNKLSTNDLKHLPSSVKVLAFNDLEFQNDAEPNLNIIGLTCYKFSFDWSENNFCFPNVQILHVI